MDATGKLLLTSLRYAQLEIGISKPFLSTNFYDYSNIITPTWITNLWQYLTECHSNIHEFKPWIYSPPRTHNFFLMDVIYRNNLPDTHKEIFNRVRLNLRLLTASEIVVANSPGKIIPSIYTGKLYRSSTLNWPTQQTLPTKCYIIFNNALKTIVSQQLNSTSLGK